jgi:hypothetical protein
MFDAGRAVAFFWAVVLAVRVRSVTALVALGVAGYLYAVGISNGWAARDRGALSAGYAFMLAFVGPSGMPRAGASALPLGSFIINRPILAQLTTAAILVLPQRLLARRAAGLRPELELARALDRAALQLTLLIVFDLVLATALETLALISR